jgi:hypothetical protein
VTCDQSRRSSAPRAPVSQLPGVRGHAQNGVYRHFKAPHFSEFFAALGDMLAGPPEGLVHEVASTLTIDDALRASGVTALTWRMA